MPDEDNERADRERRDRERSEQERRERESAEKSGAKRPANSPDPPPRGSIPAEPPPAPKNEGGDTTAKE